MHCHIGVTFVSQIQLSSPWLPFDRTEYPSKTFFWFDLSKSTYLLHSLLHKTTLARHFFTSPDLPPLNEINLILPRRLNHFYTTWSLLYHVTSFEPITWRNLEGWFDKCYDDSRVGSLRPILSNHFKLKNTSLLWKFHLTFWSKKGSVDRSGTTPLFPLKIKLFYFIGSFYRWLTLMRIHHLYIISFL